MNAAPSHRRRFGWIPVVVLLVVMFLVLRAWYLGYIDRWLYEQSLEKAGEQRQEQVATASADESAVAAEPNFVYSQLGEDDQKRYRIVLAAIETREEQPYPTNDMADLERVYRFVQADHPELFYVNGVTMETVTNTGSGLVERVGVRGRFAYSQEETEAIFEQLNAAADACLAGMPQGSDDYAKSKYFYDWLATNVGYDRETAAYMASVADQGDVHSTAQTIEGPLLKGSAVCGGYASAFQFLMGKAGIPVTYITGLGDGGPHAWCLAALDGAYYYVDPTWADPQSESDSGELGYINYDYLNITESDLARTHVTQCDFVLPDCTATADNYYLREGLYFDTPDEERLGELVDDALSAGVQLQVRCADESVYRQLLDGFIASGRIGRYLTTRVFRYTYSNENLSIVVLPAT